MFRIETRSSATYNIGTGTRSGLESVAHIAAEVRLRARLRPSGLLHRTRPALR